MKKILMKIMVIVLILLITIFGLVSCNKKINNETEKVILNDALTNNKSYNVLSIEQLNLEECDNQIDEESVVINKVKNISKSDISQIWLIYNELDSENKIMGESKMLLDMTLKPGEIFKVNFKLKECNGN
ncbi:MAG: hypothetical protein ACRDD7_17355, partial [Peptostreptococcaceae bacterium]